MDEGGGSTWPLCPLNCSPAAAFVSTSQNVTQLHLQTFLDGSRFWIQRVLLPLVVIIGVIGNGVTVVVLTRRRMRSSTNTYLTALAVSDLLYLIFVFILSLEHYPRSREQQYYLYWAARPYVTWLTDAMTSTSIWLIVTFTVERYIAVCHPLHGKMFCTESRARVAIVFIYVFWILATASTPFEWEMSCYCNAVGQTVYREVLSDLGNNELYKTLFYRAWSIASVYLPLTFLAIFNSFLILAVHRSTRTRREMTQRDNNNSSQKTENKITITLIAVVILFMLCQTPTTTVLIYKTLYTHTPSEREDILLRIFGNFTNFLVIMNAATNFILYTAMSAKYRRTVLATFCWRCNSPRSPGHSSVNTPDFSRLGRGTSTVMTTIRDRGSLHKKNNKGDDVSQFESQSNDL